MAGKERSTRAVVTAGMMCALLLLFSRGYAQDKDKEKESKEVTLKARDGFEIAATYFPPETEKSACVILLHMLGGKRRKDKTAT